MDVKIVQELKPYSFEQIANWINKEEVEAKKNSRFACSFKYTKEAYLP